MRTAFKAIKVALCVYGRQQGTQVRCSGLQHGGWPGCAQGAVTAVPEGDLGHRGLWAELNQLPA